MNARYQADFESPIGTLTVVCSNRALTALHLPGSRWSHNGGDGGHPLLEAAMDQLQAYFSGARREFDLPLEPDGTEFQRKVWQALLAVPFGDTASYAAIARAIGKPKASRAVGAANGRNPLPIIVPCHRVIGADGSLTGYGGGLDIKRRLLEHEQAVVGGMVPAR